MTEKQKDYIKILLENEGDYGVFRRVPEALKLLGGQDWEKHYEDISYAVTSSVIDMLRESQSEDDWSWNNGYA